MSRRSRGPYWYDNTGSLRLVVVEVEGVEVIEVVVLRAVKVAYGVIDEPGPLGAAFLGREPLLLADRSVLFQEFRLPARERVDFDELPKECVRTIEVIDLRSRFRCSTASPSVQSTLGSGRWNIVLRMSVIGLVRLRVVALRPIRPQAHDDIAKC